jgi:enoyl-CoA hydratase/carnithine racemase
MDDVLSALEQVPIPTIAAIQGACTGGGAAIAACCDLRIATPNLKFGFPIAKTLGNCLSISTLSRLVALLGVARTREIIFTARLIESEEALSIALVSEVVYDVVQRAMELAGILADHAPLTLYATKEGLRRLVEKTAEIEDQDLIKQCYSSNDFREGLEAFLAKRKPKWTGS